MHTEIRYRPSFAALFLTLAPGEAVRAQADAMASMTASVALTTGFFGGVMRAVLRRLFGRQSLFINTFRVREGASQGHVVLTQPMPGDMLMLELRGNAMYLEPGAFVACGSDVQIHLAWAGLRSWFQREGLFRLKVSGHGPVWIGAYGGIYEREINGELLVDTGHLVAYEPTLRLRLSLAGGLLSSFLGGEGFVTRLQGRGKVLLQSRSFGGLTAWTNAHLLRHGG